MPQALTRTYAIASASLFDVLRRPGGLIALGMATTVVAFTPAVATRALDDAAPLALQLAISTIHLYCVLIAIWAGPALTSRATALGYTPEYAATALRPAEYVVGRLAGLGALLLLHASVLSLVAAVACTIHDPASITRLACAPFTAALATAPVIALGALVGTLTSETLATLFIGLVAVAARLAPPGLSASWAYRCLIPDVLRLERLPLEGDGLTHTLLFALASSALATAGYATLTAAALGRLDSSGTRSRA